MSFLEAISLISEGKSIRRKSWDKDLHLVPSGNKVIQMWKIWKDYYVLDINDVLSNDWEEYVGGDPNEKLEKDLLERIEKSKLLKEAENKLKK